MDLKREYERIPRIMGAQTVQDRSGDFFPSDIGMKTKKLRILIAQIVWQRSVGSLFPLQNLKIFFPSDLMYAICVCEICGILFFILNLFKYFVDFLFRSACCV